MWRTTGFKGYSVSNEGQVRRDSTRRILKQQSSRGYPTVALSVNGKVTRTTVHRLVAIAFLSNELGYPEVNHIDEDKENNLVSNLEWCDRTHNNRHSLAIPLVVLGKSYSSMRAANEATGISMRNLSKLHTKAKEICV